MNPATDQIVASVREHLAANPIGDLERATIAKITGEAQLQLPFPPEVLGEVLIQFASMMRTLTFVVRNTERDAGRFLRSLPDSDNTAAGIAGNIAMLAGIQLYTGVEV